MDYKKSGVNIDLAEDFVEQFGDAQNPEKIKSILGDYASVFESNPEQWIALSCDGVGTKLLWTLEGLGNVEDLAQDLVGMCTNDLICVGATPMLFLDYLSFSDEDLIKASGLLSGFVKALKACCLKSGQFLVGGETAQMAGLYSKNHFDVAGFNVGFMKPDDFLNPRNVCVGDQLWGFSSSGPHSNGYTMLRSLFDSSKDATFISEHLMKATRLYVEPLKNLKSVLSATPKSLKACYHMTGSGWRNLLRAQADDNSFGFNIDGLSESDLPEWCIELKNRSESSWADLFSTFNMGTGLTCVVSDEASKRHKDSLEALGLKKLGVVKKDPNVEFLGFSESFKIV